MKSTIAILSILLLVGCKEKKPSAAIKALDSVAITGPFPKYVYNDCTKKWAVQLGKDIYFSEASEGWVSSNGVKIRFVPATTLGYEQQFDSKEQAISIYAKVINDERIQDSTEAAAKIRATFVKDSIFKCQHTYK